VDVSLIGLHSQIVFDRLFTSLLDFCLVLSVFHADLGWQFVLAFVPLICLRVLHWLRADQTVRPERQSVGTNANTQMLMFPLFAPKRKWEWRFATLHFRPPALRRVPQ
jgi:hypothetical protein